MVHERQGDLLTVAGYSSKPDVRGLARAGDLAGLREAAEYEELLRTPDGSMEDLGVPIREQAVLALGELAPSEIDEAVVEALTDPSDRVRMAAVRVCASKGDAALLATAVGSIPPGNGEARVLAITELLETAAVGMSRLVAEALVYRVGQGLLGDEDLLLVEAALEAEGRSDARSEVIDSLVGALSDETEDVADRAEAILAHLAPASVARLIEALERGPAPNRAASALGRTHDLRALAPLVEALGRPEAELRAECCVALGELRDPAAVEALMRATRDPEHIVRAQAGWALDHLGTLAVVVGISTLLRPLLAHSPPSGAAHGHELLENGLPSSDGDRNGANGAAAGAVPGLGAGAGAAAPGRPPLLRRLARLIDRVEDLRGASGGSH